MEDKTKNYIVTKLKDAPYLAAAYTSSGKTSYLHRHIFYKLKKYIEDFISGKSEERWIILYGLRGIGKTTIIYQMYKEIILKGIDKTDVFCLSVDELTSYANASLAEAITAYFSEIQKTSITHLQKKVFLLIDEAHFDKNWETAIKPLYDQSKNIFVIATGSSAIALKLSSDSARRSIKEPMFPLNFAEYGMLKHNIFPLRHFSEELKNLVLECDLRALVSIGEKEEKIRKEYSGKNLNFDDEVAVFLKQGGFAATLREDSATTYKKSIDVISRIVKIDIPLIQSFNTETLDDVMRVIGHLAIKKAGETSYGNISNDLKIPSGNVKKIFESLESTHLIFSVKPLVGSAGSYARASWKYYFLSSTILCALRHNIGTPIEDDNSRGMLYETAVASSIFRLVETGSKPFRIYYDKGQNGCVDFLIVNSLSGETIPVEVGSKKDKSQIKEAISRYKSKFGIIVTNAEKTQLEGRVLTIPIGTFLFG